MRPERRISGNKKQNENRKKLLKDEYFFMVNGLFLKGNESFDLNATGSRLMKKEFHSIKRTQKKS